MRSSINALTLAEYQALVVGIPKYCPNAIFTVAGQTFTALQAVTFISSVLAAVSATAAAKTGWKDAMLNEEQIVARDGPTVKAIRAVIASAFSNATTTLAEFAIVPKKPRKPMTAQARAAATAKAKATRKARGTESKKAKATVSGDVTGVTITPVTAPGAQPSPGPTPAATPAAAPTAPAAAGATAAAPPVAGSK